MFLGNIFIFGKLGFPKIAPLQLTQSWTHFEAGIMILGHQKSHQQRNIGNFEACLRVQRRLDLS